MGYIKSIFLFYYIVLVLWDFIYFRKEKWKIYVNNIKSHNRTSWLYFVVSYGRKDEKDYFLKLFQRFFLWWENFSRLRNILWVFVQKDCTFFILKPVPDYLSYLLKSNLVLVQLVWRLTRPTWTLLWRTWPASPSMSWWRRVAASWLACLQVH